MNYWLVKSEPSAYSWDRFVADKRAVWDGVRNYQARNNLQAMKKGDQVLFYHSNENQGVVGIARVVRESYQDPTTDDTRWVVVELAPLKALKNQVSLARIKADDTLQQIGLIRQSRLSVMPVTEDEFNRIIALGS